MGGRAKAKVTEGKDEWLLLSESNPSNDVPEQAKDPTDLTDVDARLIDAHNGLCDPGWDRHR